MIIDAIKNFDQLVILAVDSYITNSAVIIFFNIFTCLGYFSIGWIIFFILYSLKRKENIIWWYWIISFAIAFLSGDVLIKNFIHRLRPFVELAGISIQTIKPTSFSFPSSHALYSGAAAFIFFKLEKKMLPRILILTCSLLIALSRIILKVHYPSDVITGYILGLTIAFLVDRLLGVDRYSKPSGSK